MKAGSSLYAWASLALAAYVGLAWVHPWSEHLGPFLLLYGLAWIACWGAARAPCTRVQVVTAAIVFRALLVPLEPTLSDDVYRYVWEGRIQAAGFNPYVNAPTAPELAALRDATWAKINNPDASAIYPPLAQLVFRFLAALGGVTLFKAFFSAVDVGAILVLATALRARGAPPGLVVLYAWNPLPIVEVAGSGHLEPLAIVPLLVAVTLVSRAANTRRRTFLGGCALGASVAVKYVAALLVPFLVRESRARIAAAAGAFAVLLVVSVPYVTAGRAVFDSLLLYAAKWRYNDMLFGLLDWMLPSHWWAKLAAVVIVAALAAALVRRRVRVERAAFLVLSAVVVLSPTVHPWYLLWPLAFLPLVAWTPVFLWSGTVALAYTFLYPAWGWGPVDKANWVPRALQMLPILVWLGIGIGRRLARRSTPTRAATPRAVP